MSTSSVAQIAEARRLASTGEARRRREAARVSAREMANEVKVSHTTLLAWEDGSRVPRGDAARRWLRLLKQIEAVAG